MAWIGYGYGYLVLYGSGEEIGMRSYCNACMMAWFGLAWGGVGLLGHGVFALYGMI